MAKFLNFYQLSSKWEIVGLIIYLINYGLTIINYYTLILYYKLWSIVLSSN